VYLYSEYVEELVGNTALPSMLIRMPGRHGFEFLSHAVGDWENFMADTPDIRMRPNAEASLHEVATILVKNNWPLRQHATYGECVKLNMDVFERLTTDKSNFSRR